MVLNIDRTACAIALGFILDLCIGDPRWLYHPVRLIGLWIAKMERPFRALSAGSADKAADRTETSRGKERADSRTGGKIPEDGRRRKTAGAASAPADDAEGRGRGERRAGVGLACSTIAVTGLAAGTLVWAADRIAPAVGLAVRVVLCYFLLAARDLRDESMAVYRELVKGDLPAARRAVSMIVGRDTESLSAAGVAKAAVETVAENASDGEIAPLFYLAIGGPVLGWMYKAVNTMDSMIGYKNDRYLHFGRFAAKLDDVVNFIPARISGLLIVAAAFLTGMDGPGAFRIFRRDRLKHASPNSAQTEAAAAGALGLELAGSASYFGKRVEKPTIGDARRAIEPEDIRRANRLMIAASVLALGLFLAARALVRHPAGF